MKHSTNKSGLIDTMVQEIFVKVKISSDQKIDPRRFAWRRLNFQKLWIKDVKVSDNNEVSFTSEFNADFSKEQIKDLILNHFSMTTGEGISTKFLKIESVIEIKEEAEIYSL